MVGETKQADAKAPAAGDMLRKMIASGKSVPSKASVK
jgi:hypothetical protein